MIEEITIIANGRKVKIVGSIPRYLKEFNNWDADKGSIYEAAKDIPHESICIDAGANIGIMAVSFAIQRPDCQIIAIEPIPDNLECLYRNIAENGIKNIQVIPAALGDEHGRVSMTNKGPWSLVNDSGEINAKCVMLDDWASANVGFVKIDTEGFEPNVLAGGRQLMMNNKPLLHMEFNTWALLLQRYDPLSFAEAIWANFDILGIYFQECLTPTPIRDIHIVHDNIVKHNSVSDLVLRPKSALPSLDEMTCSPAALATRKELMALVGRNRNEAGSPPAT